MSRGRPPRKPRWQPTSDTLGIARHYASKPSADDTGYIVDSVRACFESLRTGRFTEMQFSILRGAINTARAIENQRVVKGLTEIIDAAETALEGVWPRIAWTPPDARVKQWVGRASLWHHELTDVREFVNVHIFQVRQLSYAEYQRAVASARGTSGPTGLVLYGSQAKAATSQAASSP